MALTENVTKLQQSNATGTVTSDRLSKRNSKAVMQVEAPGYDMSRAGKRFCYSGGVVANAQIPVAERPTTTAKYALWNGNPVGGAVLVIDLVAAVAASGTLGLGAALLIGVTSTVQAAAVANGMGVVLGNTAGQTTVTSLAKWGNGITLAAADVDLGRRGDGLDRDPCRGGGLVVGPDDLQGQWIVRPGCCLGVVVFALTGTTAKYTCDVVWHEVDETPEN